MLHSFRHKNRKVSVELCVYACDQFSLKGVSKLAQHLRKSAQQIWLDCVKKSAFLVKAA